MAQINITYNNLFGSYGTGDNNFYIPVGICSNDEYLFVVDKQNHRIKVHYLDGTFAYEFGSVGSGDDNFFFPEDIEIINDQLFIVDSANHRIKIHDLDGTFVSEFGSRGTGNAQFEYPVSISKIDNLFAIADKGNSRIQIFTSGASFLKSTGSIFNFCEGVTFVSSQLIAVSDSGNKNIKLYDLVSNSVTKTFGTFEFATRIKYIDEVIIISDRDAGKLIFFDKNGNQLKTYSTDLFFNEGFTIQDNKLFLCNSASDDIFIFDFQITTSLTESIILKLLALTKQLYPDGRAFWIKRGGIFHKLHEGLAQSEGQTYIDLVGLLNTILPDNSSFTDQYATKWERALGLYSNSSLSLDERKEAIQRKMNYPGGIYGRQSRVYIEYSLRKAGFDVYVHENIPTTDPVTAIHDLVIHDATTFDHIGLSGYSLIANYIDETKDSGYIAGNIGGIKQTFFIGGSTIGTLANVPVSRKNEFRELILKLKPAQMLGYLFINYV